MKTFAQLISDALQRREIVLICRSGKRSVLAVDGMPQLGTGTSNR